MKKPTALRSRKQVQNTQPPLDAASSEVFTPSSNDVALRAYLKHQNHGLEDGRDLADWLEAEAELIAEHHLARS